MLTISESEKVWSPTTTSGSVPLASRMDFCSAQSLEDMTCQSILTFVFFSRSFSHWFWVKVSPMLPQRTVSTFRVTGSLTIGRPSLLKSPVSAGASAFSLFPLHPAIPITITADRSSSGHFLANLLLLCVPIL
ncbi:hypothetical protein D3C74_362120 [compost metagenome]